MAALLRFFNPAWSRGDEEKPCSGCLFIPLLLNLLRVGLRDRKRISLVELDLVPIGVGELGLAHGIEPVDLLRGQFEFHSGEVGTQLLLVTGTNDHRGNSRFSQQPGQG